MAIINSQTLFITTSPRTPEKMIPEIELLVNNFSGKSWDNISQKTFMTLLRETDFFDGQGVKDPAFSARDRINRAPKSLGFVTLSPFIVLTPAGKALITSKRKDEVFLRQMIKFQIPSPYHKMGKNAADFCIKPFLEILRLVRTMGTLKFDELQIFGMQLTDWHDFDNIVHKIEQFRISKAKHVGSYSKFKKEYLESELKRIYNDRISRGKTKTRESSDKSLEKFLATQSSNMRDYADASFRYLKATGVVSVSYVGKSLSIVPERLADVDFILKTIDRNPVFVDDEKSYMSYLGDIVQPKLLTDNHEALLTKFSEEFPNAKISPKATTEELKDLLADLQEAKKESNISEQIRKIKDYRLYDDIQNTFDLIENKSVYDAPLMLEWNVWRAMTMLDGGNIKANLNFDDNGMPLSTAAGNQADIVCDYDDYMVIVEVTMASGQRQYEMEGEPVTRHLGKLKMASQKTCYCLFVAPKINESCIAHFFVLHHTNLSIYGGKLVIIPLPLNIFRKMVEDSYKADYTPTPSHIKKFFEMSKKLAKTCDNEQKWYEQIKEKALHWLE